MPGPEEPTLAAPAAAPHPAAPVTQAWAAELPLQPGTVVRLANRERGARLLGTPDEYSARLGPFDLTAKLGRTTPGTEADYLAHAAGQARDWAGDEVERMARAVAAVSGSLEELELHLPLPPVVEVVRSGLAEEGGMAGYTRRQLIVLDAPAVNPRTFAHELFHVLSRHCFEAREALYRLLGARVVPPLTIPPLLWQRLVTNPDAPRHDTVVELVVEGQPALAAVALVAPRAYDGGPLRDYTQNQLLLLEERDGRPRPRLLAGEAVLLAPEAAPELVARLQSNSRYDLHPEEVSAEHFVMLLARDGGLGRPDLVEGMWHELRRFR